MVTAAGTVPFAVTATWRQPECGQLTCNTLVL